MTTKTQVPKALQEEVLAEVRKRFAAWFEKPEDGPVLAPEWDWPGEPTPTIIWEGGPYEWTLLVTGGGRGEFGETYEPVEVEGVFLEPWSGYALCIYPA